jgi:DNA anti-recombination protein RmuC
MNEFENRVIELLTFLHEDVREMKRDVNSMDKRLSNVEKEIPKINLHLQEHTLSMMRLADELKQVMGHEKRITRLEMLVEGAK